MTNFVSRAGEKLQHALNAFDISVKDKIVADFGSSTGGFVDCLLQNGAKKVYSVDTAYGELAWTLRNDPRVVVMEKTNAMHVTLPERQDFISVDVGWTKQKHILPAVLRNLKENGEAVILIKPHYEADPKYIRKGKLMEEKIEEVLKNVKQTFAESGFEVKAIVESPIVGEKRGNREFLAFIKLLL